MPLGRAPADPATQQELWADLHTRMRAFVARRVADPAVADDLAQDILLRVHERLGDLRDTERLDAWAYRIARNAITDHHRSRQSRRETLTGEPVEPSPARVDADPEHPGDGDDVRAEIARCLQPLVRRLPEPYRSALELTDLGDLTQAAAAAEMRISVPGMKARVQRGRGKLRDLLLDCCAVVTDVRGQPQAYTPRRPCGCTGEAAASAGA